MIFYYSIIIIIIIIYTLGLNSLQDAETTTDQTMIDAVHEFQHDFLEVYQLFLSPIVIRMTVYVILDSIHEIDSHDREAFTIDIPILFQTLFLYR